MTDLQATILADTHVVLLRPRWARNLGSVARAMKNFGLRRLTLVDSRIGSWVDAHQMAVHAQDVLDASHSVDDLATAVGDARWVVGTSNQPPAGCRVLTPHEVATACRERGAPTLLFGGEIHGLEPAEMLRCHAVSTIPTAEEQPSLNLAQAVAVYGAELFAALQATRADANHPGGQLAAPGELMRHLEQRLRDLLEGSRWAQKSHSKNAIAELMQPFYRAGMSEAEVRAWLVALGKAAQRRDERP